jgi:glutathione S-transferase
MQGQAVVPQDKIEAIRRGYRILEQYLTKTRFLASDNMTVADLCVFAWMESITHVVPLSEKELPRVTLWLATMRRLPYYEDANKAGADLHIKIFNEASRKNSKK